MYIEQNMRVNITSSRC